MPHFDDTFVGYQTK